MFGGAFGQSLEGLDLSGTADHRMQGACITGRCTGSTCLSKSIALIHYLGGEGKAWEEGVPVRKPGG